MHRADLNRTNQRRILNLVPTRIFDADLKATSGENLCFECNDWMEIPIVLILLNIWISSIRFMPLKATYGCFLSFFPLHCNRVFGNELLVRREECRYTLVLLVCHQGGRSLLLKELIVACWVYCRRKYDRVSAYRDYSIRINSFSCYFQWPFDANRVVVDVMPVWIWNFWITETNRFGSTVHLCIPKAV